MFHRPSDVIYLIVNVTLRAGKLFAQVDSKNIETEGFRKSCFLEPKYAKLKEMPGSYVEDVKNIHQNGDHGSQG